jgi:hypothetical protein
MVAVAGTRRSPQVVHRSRVEMITGTGFRARQPYHNAAEMKLDAAKRFIATALHSATQQAAERVSALLTELRGQREDVKKGGILLASGRALPELRSILASHALIHAAEGELFRTALIQACQQCAVNLTGTREREIMSVGSKRLNIKEGDLGLRLTEMGRALGRPWRQDEKLATLAAWLALPA